MRKNPETKAALGVEFASGWGGFSVAQALALPKFITRKLARSSLSALYANTEALIQHTNTFDRGLAKLFYWLLTLSILGLLAMSLVV